jgi:hypothetical protein
MVTVTSNRPLLDAETLAAPERVRFRNRSAFSREFSVFPRFFAG